MVSQVVIDSLIQTVQRNRTQMDDLLAQISAINGQKSRIEDSHATLAQDTQNLVEAIKGMGGPDLDSE